MKIIDQFTHDINNQKYLYLGYINSNIKLDINSPVYKIAETNIVIFQKAFGNLFNN